jgi:hypothetical protein
MEAVLGIAIYIYIYTYLISTSKMHCLSYYCLYLLFNKIGEKGRTCSEPSSEASGWAGRGQEGEMAQTMYAHNK